MALCMAIRLREVVPPSLELHISPVMLDTKILDSLWVQISPSQEISSSATPTVSKNHADSFIS